MRYTPGDTCQVYNFRSLLRTSFLNNGVAYIAGFTAPVLRAGLTHYTKFKRILIYTWQK